MGCSEIKRMKHRVCKANRGRILYLVFIALLDGICVCVCVCFSWGVVRVSLIDDVLAVASILSFCVCVCVCVCCLGGLCEHKFKGFGDVGSRVQDYWFAVEFRMLQSYLITYKLSVERPLHFFLESGALFVFILYFALLRMLFHYLGVRERPIGYT